MKIIAFSTSLYPNGFSPMINRLHLYMKALKLKNVDVEIVVPSIEKREDGIFDGIPFSYVKVLNQSNRFNGRIVANEYISICSELAKRCDVLFISEERNYIIKNIARVVHNAGCKIVLEQNENPYSMIGSRKDFKFILKLNRIIYLTQTLKRVDGIIVISHKLYDLVNSYKRNDALLVRIPILTGHREIKRNYNYNDVPFILHAGSLSEQKDGVKAMLEAFLIAHNKLNGNLKFVFTSKLSFPALIRWIDKFIIKNKLENKIIFKGLIPKDELDELYNNCSMAIVNKPSNFQNDYNFPTKLTELLPREIPIVISNTGELCNYFQDNINSYLVEANNIDSIAIKIIDILSNTEKAKEIAHKARLLAEAEFYFEKHANILLNFLISVKEK